jgi:hypothetical protein
MSIRVTRYETENGKTRKAKIPAAKPAGKNGAPEQGSWAGSKNNPPAAPANKERP